MRSPEARDESSPLLVNDTECMPTRHSDPCAPNPFAHLPVYKTIHRIRREILNSLEDPYSLDQLLAPRINVEVVRPLVNRLWERQDVSYIYCLLVNKLQFLREQGSQQHTTMSQTRAWLCELLATKMLRRFDEDNPGTDGLLLVSNAMVAGFWPFQRAPASIIKQTGYVGEWPSSGAASYQRTSTALEIAIISESKMLISTPACQKIMQAIHVGRIVYTPSSFIDILPDHYKHKPLALYRPEEAPLLNQYRLMVPRTRNILDFCQFLVLLILYILVMQHRQQHHFTRHEILFCIYGLGWVLDEFASMVEHGWHCYTQNLWSFLDAIFSLLFVIYFALRMHSLVIADGESMGETALNILAASAPVLIPRLAFNLMSENMLIVSLRAMMSDFLILTFLAVWCFAGFLLSLSWLSEDTRKDVNSLTISKWLLYVWFGLDGTGIQESVSFHWLIGPILMVMFAFLGNTLFLTILVSMLSSTFSKIAVNATAEIQFRRAVTTFEGVKRDSIFAYQPPFNLLALCLMLPMKLVMSPRWFHKVNVTVIRTLNFPLLLLIAAHERRHLWQRTEGSYPLLRRIAEKRNTIPDDSTWLGPLTKLWDLSRFSVHGDTEAVFEFDAPADVLVEIAEERDEQDHVPLGHNIKHRMSGHFPGAFPGHQTSETAPLLHTVSSTGSGRSMSASPVVSRPTQSFASTRKHSRRESVGGVQGLADHLMTDNYGEPHDRSEKTVVAKLERRLQRLEAMNVRMEKLLLRIGENFPDGCEDDEDGDEIVEALEAATEQVEEDVMDDNEDNKA